MNIATGEWQQNAAATDIAFRRYPAIVAPRHRMLLLHGLANSAAVWKPYLNDRPDDIEAWAADLPWRGDGDPVWSHQGAAVDRMRDAIEQVPEPVDVLVAHSFSVCVLMGLLGREWASGVDPLARWGIRALVLVSPFYRRRPKDFSWQDLAGFGATFGEVVKDGIRLQSGGRLDEQALSDVSSRVCDLIGPYGWLRFFEAYLGSPWLRVDRLTVPCLVVSGSLDAASGDADALTEDLPNATLDRLPGCAHFPMLERVPEFAASVDGFLRTVHTGRTEDQPCRA